MAESVFQTYLNRLTDLSSKNRSLYLPKLDGSGLIDVREFDFLNGESAFEILRKVIQGKKQIPLIPEVDPRIGETNQISKKLSRIAFRDQLTQEETGDQNLYLAWPFIEGKLISGQVLRAPILLIPVALEAKKGEWNLNTQTTWEWNSALLLAYRQAYGKEIDVESMDEALQNCSDDATEFRTQLNRIISENFQVQLSSTLFEDQITAFPLSQISLDQVRFEEGRLALKAYAVIGQFGQKSSFISRDYEELKVTKGVLSLEGLFEQFFALAEKEPIPREDQLFPVFPLDASQENVLVKVRQGKSLVIEGPPGTGKSQLIANLISDYISRGKKVLVVSQKRAALDVVFDRMGKAGFGNFLALVHDFRGDQRALFEKLRSQIEAIESYQEQNRGIDSMQLEREISQLSKRISILAEKFEGLRQELFNEKRTGIPIKAMYSKVQMGKPALNSFPQLLKLDYNQAQEFESDFKIFHSYHHKFSGSFWEKRLSFVDTEQGNFGRIWQSLKGVEVLRESIPAQIESKAWLNLVAFTLDSGLVLGRIRLLQQALERLPNLDKAHKIALDPKEIKKLNQVQNWLIQAVGAFAGLNLILPDDTAKIEDLVSELDILIPKSGSFLGVLASKWSKAKYPRSFHALADNGLRFELASLTLLDRESKVRIRLHEEFQDLPKIEGFAVDHFSQESLISLLDQGDRILAWAQAWNAFAEIHDVADWQSIDLETFESDLSEVVNWVKDFEASSPGWKLWLCDTQILAILKSGLSELSLDNELNLNQTWVELTAFDRFLRDWGPEKQELALEVECQFPELTLDAKLFAFRNGWHLAWIGELERRNPVLAEAGSLKLSQEMDELKTAILEKRKISRHMSLLRLREQVSSHLEYNRLGNRLSYRDLYHQVSKKRLRWPVRKLVEEMDSEVFRLLPCWLASPETVSALFPMKEKFDLVIFDEASQCQVERGLQAMLRGRQVVIAGDSKQLRPSDFYQVKWESEEEGMEYEAESLLELAGHFFEKHQLKGHYRSADPALIHFSNSHFYNSQLETLPDYQTVVEGKTPFSWEKTYGIWENQVNKTDADAVVEKVKTIRKRSPRDTIGIVTGNYFQMELIRERLCKAGIGDGEIKVRNIENVQGDEFDQVILSLGYAANREGKLVTNFGLLGKSGAENRLNVAITRARRMLHVISSVEPEDFRPGQLQNPGLVLLREFFGFAKAQSIKRDIPPPEVKVIGYELDWSLKNRILESDPSFSKKIPSAVMDLVKRDSEANQTAILTDDQRLFNAPTAKAAVAYHPILLEEKGWEWEWRWSREGLRIGNGEL